VAVLVFTAIMQIKYVNRALQRFDATQVIPTQFVLFTLCVILGSAVLYRDFERTPGEDAGKFIGGCALTFIGVWLITTARPSPSDGDSEFDDEDDEAIALRVGEQFQDDTRVNGSQASIRHSIAESEDDVESQRLAPSLRGNPSKVSLPESLERNHWDSVTESTSTTPRRQSISAIRTGRSGSILETSPIEENPWQLGTQGQGLKPKSSFRRLLGPLTSLFPHQSSEDVAPILEARHSAPDLPTGVESTATTPRTRSSSYHDDEIPIILGTSLPTHHAAHPRRNSLYLAPFTSPLSSSLTAVVADSIRRRVRIHPRRSIRSRLPTDDVTAGQQTRSRGNSEPLDVQAQAAVLEHALRSGLDGDSGGTPSRRRGRDAEIEHGDYDDDGGGDDDDDDDGLLRSEPSSPSPGIRKTFGERLGSIFRSRKAKLSSSKRHSDERGTSTNSAEEQV
jgi:magnesium transporter